MSDAQAFSLWLSCMIGAFSCMLLVDWKEYSSNKKILVSIWLIFWLAPPLLTIWIKGVFG